MPDVRSLALAAISSVINTRGWAIPHHVREELADAVAAAASPCPVQPEAETEWGIRYQDDDGHIVTMPYPEDEVRQVLRESGDPGPSVRRAVVARQVGPWPPARLAAAPACRHCGGELFRCDPPHDMPACLGWKHVARLSMGPVGPHYCGGRSVNPSGEPGEEGS